MDTMFKFGAKVTFTKEVLDAKLGVHDAAFYNEERMIRIGEQQYVLRGPSRTEENAWEYNEVFEVAREDASAYHVTTDYRDEFPGFKG